VVTSLNCDNAINLCEEQNFDLIICDLHFGQDCKNGLQLLEELHLKKYLAPHTVFIMASADAERSMVLGSIERSPDEYLVKPFSPAQLELRLHKQLAKKTELQAVYTAIYQQQPEAAITACKNILKTNHHHKNDCIKLLTKLYWQNDQYQNAKSLLEALPQSKNNHWLNISLAQTDYLLGNYQASIDRCERVLLKNKMQVDAHDIIAASYLKMKQQRKAFYAIENALYFSPYSLKRNLKACEIARENNELANIINYSRQIWEITKHSIHFDLAHLCNYVRSHLDAAEQVTDPNTKDRLQQQAFQSLKQMTEDTSVKSKWKTFDPEMYREIVNARVLFPIGAKISKYI
jgi:CheY-like chemotaxis protein